MANEGQNPLEGPLEPLSLVDSPNIARSSIDSDDQLDEPSRLVTSPHLKNVKGGPERGHENVSRHFSSYDSASKSSRPRLKAIQFHSTGTSVEAPGMGHTESVRIVYQPIGERRQKQHIYPKDIFALVISLFCLLVSIKVVLPGSFSWELGLKRQLQLVGLCLSTMDICRKVLMPKVFLMVEAQFGKSYIQNYDAILRNSTTVSHMAFLWRVVLLVVILLPSSLSFAYKEFFSGTAAKALKTSGGYYGLAAPGQLAITGGTSNGGILGVSAMVNATLPFIQAAANDSK